MPMKPAIKRAWVAALRSGKYKQGQNRLKTMDGRFCCLGVLCDLHNQTVVRNQWTKDISGPNYGYGKHRSAGVLPLSVMRWAGLTDDDPNIEVVGNTLAGLNDSGRYRFRGIARLIEKHL